MGILRAALLSTLLAAGVSAWAARQPAQVVVSGLRCEYKVDPVGIDALRPRLSWRLQSSARGVVQGAYRIQVAKSQGALESDNELLWDSGKVASDQSVHVVYAGPNLESSQRYYWRVRSWNGDGQPSDWSAAASWEMGLLQPSDWEAEWITPDWEEDKTQSQPSPMLRKTFRVDGEVISARLYVTSLGLYEAHLNGSRVGDEVLTPGWTSYDTRLQYQTYDVTGQIVNGENTIGAILGDGWYRGFLGWADHRNSYGDTVALLLQLRLVHDDGRVEVIGSDDSWKASTGPILLSDIYHGETYDARLEKEGWAASGYGGNDWSSVSVLEHGKEMLLAPAGPPVRKIEEIRPVKIIQTPEGDTVFDMGQNMVGWVRLRVSGEAGTVVTLRHAEVLDKEGNFYTANLRSAKQTIQYTLKGGGEEIYEPHFTFQGFRFVDVDGYPGELTIDSLTGVVVHSGMKPTGTLTTSKPLLNQLQHNIQWGQKGNFVDVPTDCPQRDERLGWTGDAQAFARSAAFNMDVAAFFTKWLGDLAADQNADGKVPHVIPDVLGGAGSAAWGDASTIVPWTVYLAYGDKRILETQYASMKAWVEYIRSTAGESRLWNTGFHFGDWLAFATTRSDYPGATTGKDLIATAFFAHSASLLQRTAEVLGKHDDARYYERLTNEVKAAWRREFVTPNGRVGENTQTAYVLALMFDLLPEHLRLEAARRLAADIASHGTHLTTGFAGTPYLCHVLSRHGQIGTAFKLLNQESYPSWLYPVTQGATTIWERWDGQKPDGTFQDVGMNSFNHYAYGAIGDWMYRVVAGLDTAEDGPGYKHVLIQPHPGGGLREVSATLDTLYGEAGSSWKLDGSSFELEAVVPPNTRATIRLPGAQIGQVMESGVPLEKADGVSAARQEGDAVVVETGSGRYRFTTAR